MISEQLWFHEAGVFFQLMQVYFCLMEIKSFCLTAPFCSFLCPLRARFFWWRSLNITFFSNIFKRPVSSHFLSPSMVQWILASLIMFGCLTVRDCPGGCYDSSYLIRMSLFAISCCLQGAVGVPFNQQVQKWRLSIFLMFLNRLLIILHLFGIWEFNNE